MPKKTAEKASAKAAETSKPAKAAKVVKGKGAAELSDSHLSKVAGGRRVRY